MDPLTQKDPHLQRKVASTPLISRSSVKQGDVTDLIRNELSEHKEWTSSCTEAFRSCLPMLFKFDRISHGIAKAFGNDDFKILLNPLRILCYHPECVKNDNGALALHQANDLHNYLEHLRLRHDDAIASSMYKRLCKITKDDMFATEQELDRICASPFSLMNPLPMLKYKPGETNQAVEDLVRYSIYRDLESVYICHWKNMVIRSNLINSQSLSFQEDDALVELIVNYPNVVTDWKRGKTLSLFLLKLFTSVSGTAANLFRGFTYYPRISHGPERSLEEFVDAINHPGPSITSLQRWLPAVSYENEQYHKVEQLFHILFLKNNPDALKLDFGNSIRYITALGIDEQEINQGTFIHDNVLHGLQKKLHPEDVVKIGYSQLADYISNKAPYVSSVREYRLIDFRGIFSSNICTSFIAGSLDSIECAERLDLVKKLSTSCQNCLLTNIPCNYVTPYVQSRCENCAEKDIVCISMVVFHVFWDMGGCHKKMAREFPKIDKLSTDTEYQMMMQCSIGFGGLHLAKAITNCSRNCSMTLNGNNYGMHVLRAMRLTTGDHQESLQTIKTAVFVGKDRQSDYESFMSSSVPVQSSLRIAQSYTCVRTPEPVLAHVDNAKKQKKIRIPTGLACNVNGDPFILDTGSSCIMALSRSSVAQMFIIGEMKSNTVQYRPNTESLKVGQLRLSNDLPEMVMKGSDLYIVDAGREEIIMVHNVNIASNISSRLGNVIKKPKVSSICFFKESMICLCDDMLEFVKHEIPKTKRKHIVVTSKVEKKIKLPCNAKEVFGLTSAIGIWTYEKAIILCHSIKGHKALFKTLTITSPIRPIAEGDNIMYMSSQTKCIVEASILYTKKGDVTVSEDSILKDVPENVKLFHRWGKTWFFITMDKGVVKLLEHGPTQFGLRLTKCLHTLYNGISYIPPHGFQSAKELKLKECAVMASELSNLLNEVEADCKRKFPTLSTFNVKHGSVATETLRALEDSIESWESLCSRLDYFDPTLKDLVVPHTVMNESIVEHQFGFTVKKGQSALQTFQEYVQHKQKHAIDFLIKMCEVPFNQDVKIKLRDRDYQHIRTMISKISVDEVWKILNAISSKYRDITKKTAGDADTDKEVDQSLYKAFLLTKAVPRKSNRAKWNEESDYAPNFRRSST